MRSRSTAFVALLLATVVGTLLGLPAVAGSVPAASAPAPAAASPRVASAPAPASALEGAAAADVLAGLPPELLRTLVVLDVSGSMARDGGHGETLLQGAKRALSELVYSVPRESEMGLRVYGSEQDNGCTDTTLLEPVGPLRPEKIIDAAEPLQPRGDTPIGYALSKAMVDIRHPGTARDVVVLISDGEDNCSSRPPCEVMRELKKNNLDVRVETVGVALEGNQEARDQLRCIAEASGGAYYDADNSDALSAALKEIAQQALGTLGEGTFLQGSPDPDGAPLIQPGDYRLKMSRQNSAWYRFKAPDGTQPRLLSTVQGGAKSLLSAKHDQCPMWRARLVNPAEEELTFEPYSTQALFNGGGYGTTGVSTSGPVSDQATNPDFSGEWRIELSLGRGRDDGVMDCAKDIPKRRLFDARLSLDLDALVTEPVAATTEPSPTSDPTDYSSPSAADQYQLEDDDDGGGLWAVVVPVLLFVGLAGGGFAVYRARLRRTRGW